jgi:hypothetical protein
MPITNRNLTPGTILSARYKGAAHQCTVVATETGVGYELDGKIHKSPSSAASAMMGGMSANGWRVWTVVGEEPAKAETTPTEPKAPRTRVQAAPKPKTIVQIKRLRTQEGCAEGEVRWFCSACMDGWCLPKGETPTVCPKGHPREATDELASPAGDAAEVSPES